MEFDLILSEKDKRDLLETARLSIYAGLYRKKVSYPQTGPAAQEKCGAFVSLHLNGTLRGCIGYIRSDKPLQQTIIDAAKSAAFSDYRFQPLDPSEFNEIDLEISVLSPFELIDDVNIIIPGKHGLYISKGFHSGLLLPQVATEYNWNRKEFLANTCRKAGLEKDSWKDPDCKIEIFTALVFS